MEAALAYAVLHEGVGAFDDGTMPSAPFIKLKEAGMLNLTTDASHSLVMIHGVTPLGIGHYQGVLSKRRQLEPLEAAADELIGAIVANNEYRKIGRETALFHEEDHSVDDFRALSRAGLLDVMWADDIAYHYTVTDKGNSYVKGYFMDQLERQNVHVELHNCNNAVGGNATSTATASNTAVIDLSAVILAIQSSQLDDAEKVAANTAAAELQEAATKKDVEKFMAALEKITGIAKTATSLAKTVLPFAARLIGEILG